MIKVDCNLCHAISIPQILWLPTPIKLGDTWLEKLKCQTFTIRQYCRNYFIRYYHFYNNMTHERIIKCNTWDFLMKLILDIYTCTVYPNEKAKLYNQNHIMIISLNYHSHTIGVVLFQFIVRDKLFTKIMLTMFKAGHKLWLSCIIS